MAVIKPFRAIRPAQGLAQVVAAPPYDVMNADEARELAAGNADSFLHVSRSEIDLPPGTDPYSDEVYAKARENLQRLLADGVLLQDTDECLYIYALTMNGRTQTGIVACTAVEDYLSGEIRRHELTRADKEDDRTRHIEYCNANTGPVFLTYHAQADISRIVGEWAETHTPLYDFTSQDGITHRVHRIDDAAVIAALEDRFHALPLYIADGHHRNAAAARVALARRAQADAQADCQTKTARPYDFYLAILFPDNDLRIMDYNRVVKDLNGLTPERFLDALREGFDIDASSPGCEDGSMMLARHQFGLYLAGRWYVLTAKPEALAGRDTVTLLDVSVLQELVLDRILGITDPRSDKRIDFVGGIRGRAELQRRVDSGEMAAAFAMCPTAMDELMAIADQGKIMPPKSTWFEPKPRSGLFVRALA